MPVSLEFSLRQRKIELIVTKPENCLEQKLKSGLIAHIRPTGQLLLCGADDSFLHLIAFYCRR